MRTLIALVLTGSVLIGSPARSAELSLEQAKEGADIVIEAAVKCSDYKHDPTILARIRRNWQQHLIDAGMSAGDADELMDKSAALARADPDTEDAIKIVDCPMAGVKHKP